MADDIVQEQMGDILSAYGIPDLAKHIVPIPLPPLDPDEDEEEPKEDGEEEGGGKGGERGGGGGDEAKKDRPDDVKDADKTGEDGDGDEESTKLPGEEEEAKDGQAVNEENLEDETAMETTDEGTDGSTDSQNGDEASSPPQDGQAQASTEQPRNNVPDLGLKQSVASLGEDGHGDKDSTLIKQLLKSTSKPVMSSRLQDELPHPDASPDVPEKPAVLEIPHVESLTSLDEFNSYVERCKEGRGLVGMKMDIIGRTNCVSSYQCPNLTEEQMKVLDMGKETFQCQGCDDSYLFKSSLEAHLERRTVLVTFYCKWCSGRKNLVFYNKCTFMAHLHNHGATEKEIDAVKLQASVSPVNPLDSLKIFTRLTAPVRTGDTSKPSVEKSSLSSSTPQSKKQSLMSHLSQPVAKSAPASVEKSPYLVNTNNTKAAVYSVSSNKALSNVRLPRSFVCMGCKRRYERMSHLRAHLDRPHPETNTPGYKGPLHQCRICKLVVANKCKLMMHDIIHRCEDNTPLPCPECGCLFTDLKSLLIHQNDGCLHWMTRPLFKCTFCSKYATTFQGLVKHFEQNHVEVFYKCPLCQLAFRNNQSASEHSMQVHRLKSVTYGLLRKCPFCKSVYSERNMLASHFDSHYQNGLIKIEKFVFSCSICSKPFDYGHTLRNHLKNEHDRSNNNMFNCDLCMWSFNRIEGVMQHRRTCVKTHQIHSKPGQPEQKNPSPQINKQFVCGECGERFPIFNTEAVSKHMLEKHKDQMQGKLVVQKEIQAPKEQVTAVKSEPPVVVKKAVPLKVERFTDQQCSKCQFKSKDRLFFEKHIVGHKTEESFSQCHECGLCFTVVGSLKKHLFIKHKIKDMVAFNSLFEELIPKWEEDMKKKKLEEKEKEAQKMDVKEEEKEEEKKADAEEETKEDKKEEENEEETSLFKCKVCKVDFENDKALTVHARSHGLAYLQHTLTRSPEKAVRLMNSKPAASPVKKESSKAIVQPEVKASERKGTIPPDTDSSTCSDDTNSTEDDIDIGT